MDKGTEPIRQDIDHIRESMTDKMEQIEAQIKGTVSDTTETLKRSLDVKYQVSQHPWAAVGVAVLAGYALGSMGGSDDSPSTYRYRDDFRHNESRGGEPMRYYGPSQSSDWASNQSNGSSSSYSSPSSSSYSSPSSSSSNYSSSSSYSPSSYSQNNFSYGGQQQQSSSGGFLNEVMGQLGGELDTLKTAAISSLIALVRDTVRQNLPGVYEEAERLRSGSQSYNSGSNTGGSSSNYSASSGSGYGSSGANYGGSSTSGMNSSNYGTSGSTYGMDNASGSYSNRSENGTSSSFGSSGNIGSSAASTGLSGEGEFYREADITEGNTPTYDRTAEIYPAGSSESDKDTTSTQREIGRNPNYDMIPPSPHANPDGRP